MARASDNPQLEAVAARSTLVRARGVTEGRPRASQRPRPAVPFSCPKLGTLDSGTPREPGLPREAQELLSQAHPHPRGCGLRFPSALTHTCMHLVPPGGSQATSPTLSFCSSHTRPLTTNPIDDCHTPGPDTCGIPWNPNFPGSPPSHACNDSHKPTNTLPSRTT